MRCTRSTHVTANAFCGCQSTLPEGAFKQLCVEQLKGRQEAEWLPTRRRRKNPSTPLQPLSHPRRVSPGHQQRVSFANDTSPLR